MNSRVVRLPALKRSPNPRPRAAPTARAAQRTSPKLASQRLSPSPYLKTARPPKPVAKRSASVARKHSPARTQPLRMKRQPNSQIQPRLTHPDSASTTASSFAFTDLSSQRPSLRYEFSERLPRLSVVKSLSITPSPSDFTAPSSLLQTKFRSARSQQEPFNMNSPSSRTDLNARLVLEKIESAELLSVCESDLSSVEPPEPTITPANLPKPQKDAFEQVFAEEPQEESKNGFDLDALSMLQSRGRRLVKVRQKLSVTPTPTVPRLALGTSESPTNRRPARSNPRGGHTALFNL